VNNEGRTKRSQNPGHFYAHVAHHYTDSSEIDDGEGSKYYSAMKKVTTRWGLILAQRLVGSVIRRSQLTIGSGGHPILDVQAHREVVMVLTQPPREVEVYGQIRTLAKKKIKKTLEEDEEGEGIEGNPFQIYSRLALHHPSIIFSGTSFDMPKTPEEVETLATMKIRTLGCLLLHFLSGDTAPHVTYDTKKDQWKNALSGACCNLRHRPQDLSKRERSTRKFVIFCYFPSALPKIISVS
jgi:hypothetical protein